MTQTANMVSSKIMWNSVISTPNAKFTAPTSRICISKHLSIDMSTWKCHCDWFLKISSNITDYAKKPLMVISAWKSEMVCTASHKPASLPKSSSNSILHAMDTLNSPTRLASGNMFHIPTGSTCVWMTQHQIHRWQTPQAPLCCPSDRNL